jgi:hypothetical protein
VRPRTYRSHHTPPRQRPTRHLLISLGGLGLVTTAVDRHRRTLYDLVTGGIVVQETDDSLRPRGLLDRLAEYGEENKRIAIERKKSLLLLTAFWAWLSKLGEWILAPLNWLRGGQGPAGPSVLKVVSGKVAAGAAAAVTAAAAIVVAIVPQAREVGEWLVTERYWLGDDPSTPSVEAIADWMAAQDEPYVGACPDPSTVGDSPGSWCTGGPRLVTMSDEPGLANLGASTGELYVLGMEGWWDSFWAEILVVEASDGWRVAAVRELVPPGDLEYDSGAWLSPEVGVTLGLD